MFQGREVGRLAGAGEPPLQRLGGGLRLEAAADGQPQQALKVAPDPRRRCQQPRFLAVDHPGLAELAKRLGGVAVQHARTAVRLAQLQVLGDELRSEEHTSELQSLMRISYAVFCLKKKKYKKIPKVTIIQYTAPIP